MRLAAVLGTVLVLAALGGGAGAAAGPATLTRTCGVICGDRLPAWSPDGRTIAFVHYVRVSTGTSSNPRQTIYTVGAKGGAPRAVVGVAQLWPSTPGGPSGPFGELSWSPDSRQLAVASAWGGGSIVVPAAGGPAQPLSGDDPSWSPDSQALALAFSSPVFCVRRCSLVPAGVAVVRPDGSGRTVLAGTHVSVKGGVWASSPLWSSAGEIAYVTGSRMSDGIWPNNRTAEIWSVRPDGTGARRLVLSAADDFGYRPLAWSGDGQRLFFLSGRSALEAVNRDGSDRTVLHVEWHGDIVSLSPEGRFLAVQRLRPDGGADLHLVDLPARRDRRLVLASNGSSLAATLGRVTWSPDGERLAFAADGECFGWPGLHTVGHDGAELRRLTSTCRRNGRAGRDLLRGGNGPDALYGHAGRDDLDGRGGPDFVQGGDGDDVVRGSAGDDRLYGGKGTDRLLGGGHDDLIVSRDRVADEVRCGTGRDRVQADRLDDVAVDCELVERR